MRSALRTVVLMVQISLRADAVRSVFAVVTAVGQMASLPLRALGLRAMTDGFIARDAAAAARGAAVIVGLTAIHRVMVHASLNVRMRLRENTQVYLDSHIMGMTAGIPGLEHHERPEYLDQVELIRNERGYLANPFNPISWTVASLVVVAALITSMLWVCGVAVVADATDAVALQHGLGFALMNLAWAPGHFVGAALGGGAAAAAGDALPYLALATTCALMLLLVPRGRRRRVPERVDALREAA
ncbi:MAG: hypothetical protein KY396_03165 [Actinobacteria bacterium]|nr:hypothetical protein [Actinomycetota bacterium]